MAVAVADIQLRQSGAANLGGALSANAVSLASLFDTVLAPESLAGDKEYRCAYLVNASAQTWADVVAWLAANTPSISTQIDIGLGTAGLSATEQTIANEGTAPAGVTFSAAATKAAGLGVGSLPAGGYRAIWFCRTVAPGTAAVSDTATLQTEGTTGP